jgi:hypothetical protein
LSAGNARPTLASTVKTAAPEALAAMQKADVWPLFKEFGINAE